MDYRLWTNNLLPSRLYGRHLNLTGSVRHFFIFVNASLKVTDSRALPSSFFTALLPLRKGWVYRRLRYRTPRRRCVDCTTSLRQLSSREIFTGPAAPSQEIFRVLSRAAFRAFKSGLVWGLHSTVSRRGIFHVPLFAELITPSPPTI